MIGKFFSHLLGNTGDDFAAADDAFEELMEFEEGGWVIVNLPGEKERGRIGMKKGCRPRHPHISFLYTSMSVYQMRHRMSSEEEEEEEELGSDEDEDSPRPVAVRQHISWRLAAWGVPLPYDVRLLAVQRARTQAERKKLSRSALHRQNLAKTRFSPAERRYGHFKQPCQRLYNY